MVGDRGGGTVDAEAPRIESCRVAELFGLLSDQSRAGILYALLEAGELSADDLTNWTGVPSRRAAEALRVLRAARVVDSRRSEAGVVYQLVGDHVRRLLQVAGTSGARGRARQLRGLDARSRSA